MATRQDLHIRQGETWSFVWTKTSGGSAVDLTGYEARMAIRRCVGGALEAYLSSEGDADGGTITLGGAAGTVTLAMTATESGALGAAASWPWAERHEDRETYRYDLELVSAAGAVTRELEGRVILSREVTT